MDSTHLKLPFLAPAQAQKHVTVNESLRRLDVLVQMQVAALGRTAPPSSPQEGDGYGLGSAPTGAWANKANQLAFYQDGAWIFLTPKVGWRVWDKANRRLAVWTGNSWLAMDGASNSSASTMADNRLLPDGLQISTTQIDHVIVPGGYNNTSLIIPAHTFVFGITARVLTGLPYSRRWRLGIPTSSTRYGNALSGRVGTTVTSITSYPVGYRSNTAIRISAYSSSLTSGKIRLKLYFLQIALPPA